VWELRIAQDLGPDFAAPHRGFMHFAVRLANGPDHPEITDRGAGRARASLEHYHFPALLSCRIRVRQSQYSAAYDCNIGSVFHCSKAFTWCVFFGAITDRIEF